MRPLSELDSAYLVAHAQSRDLHRPVVAAVRPVEMRVLTVRQPWAWQILHEGKRVENRTRSLGPYRGPVAIHAGLRADEDALRRLPGHPPSHVTAPRVFFYGAIIGVVDLVDVHTDDECYDLMAHPGHMCSPWAMGDHNHLVLANPRPLARPIPAKGRLGLWRPDAALSAAITAALAPVQTITDQEDPR